ncbi:hypothetical protein MSAN_00831500 [Mycena sanguinolenta]|uniref:Uncharacterized protein n=1 Tax=Mycena sanguinolenta TaxID=230812 RepID=A0A8H7DD30_9AGAR|nr:hypothetical protein MSAN_00831500 [Mycena sanguinolenta]
MKKHKISYIECLFSAIQKLPDGHLYDQEFFQKRLDAAVHLAECRKALKYALIACDENPEQLLKLPKVVNDAINTHLYKVGEKMERLPSSSLPDAAPTPSNDDDNETDSFQI